MYLKRVKRPVAILLGLGLMVCAGWGAAALPPGLVNGNGEPTLAPMLERVLPGVVNISTKSIVRMRENPLFSDPFFRRFFNIPDMPRERERQSLGSGVIVDARSGYIVTNNHVIDRADEITVTLRDRRSFSAKVIGKDPEADLAVIQIEAEGLTAVPLADSDALRVGDFVVAIGNPFGLGQTVTSGIVSALGRSGLGIEGYEDFIQTDASINPGNSGGALVDLKGSLVGINTAIVGPAGGNVGIGFAIPANMARDIMAQLIEFGEVKRGQLGVMIQDLTPELAKAFELSITEGVVVSQVIKDSPAERAGIKAGDVITGANDKPVRNAADLRNAIGLQRLGAKVAVELLRNGQSKRVTVVIEERQAASAAAADMAGQLEGATLGEIEDGHPLAGRISGVEVLEVEQGSRAWRAGLRGGDVIVSVNRQPVAGLQDVAEALRHGERGILLNVRRGDGALFIVIR